MIKEFCDLCNKHITDGTLGDGHWCGNFKIKDVKAEVNLTFDAKVCYDCRKLFEKQLVKELADGNLLRRSSVVHHWE